MVEVATLELNARSDGLLKAEAALDRVTAAAVKTDAAADRVTVGAGRMGDGMGRASGVMANFSANSKQMSWQLSQIAQQGAATGQWAQAFAIQLGDIVPLLGVGGLIGTGVTALAMVALPSLIGSLGTGAGSAQSFADALGAVEENLSDTSELADIAGGNIDALTERFGALTPAVQALVASQADVSLRSMADAASALSDELSAMYNGNAWLNVSRAEDLSNGLDLGTKAGREMAFMLEELSQAGSLDQQLAYVTAIRERFVQMVGPVGQMTGAQFEFYQRVVDSEGALRATKMRAEELAGAAKGAATAAASIDDNAPGSGWLSGAISDAAALAVALWDAVAARREVHDQTAIGGGRSAGPGGPLVGSSDLAELQAGGGVYRSMPKKAKSSGGGKKAEDFKSKLEALQNELMTEAEIVDAWYKEQQAVLKDRRSLELLGAQEHKAALERLEVEHQERLFKAQSDTQNRRLNDTASFFGGMAQLAAAGGDRMAKAAKTFGAAEALVNSYVAFTAVLRDPSFIGRPLARIGAAAAVLAQGLSAVRAINGGGGGGSVGSAAIGSAPSQAPAQQDRLIRVNIEGDTMFADALRGSIRTIANALGEERNIGGFQVV